MPKKNIPPGTTDDLGQEIKKHLETLLKIDHVNVLEDERIRVGMKEYSQWPTFPQIYIEGEFYGGCDILLEAYQSGELEEYIERVLAS